VARERARRPRAVWGSSSRREATHSVMDRQPSMLATCADSKPTSSSAWIPRCRAMMDSAASSLCSRASTDCLSWSNICSIYHMPKTETRGSIPGRSSHFGRLERPEAMAHSACSEASQMGRQIRQGR